MRVLVRVFVIILMFYPILILGQENALIIIHKGESNSFIHPVVFADDTLNKVFCDTNLRIFGKVSVPKKRVSLYKLSKDDIQAVSMKLDEIIEKEKQLEDTILYRSFHFIYIENGKRRKKTIVDVERGLTVLRQFLGELNYSNPNYAVLNMALEQLILQFDKESYIQVKDLNSK